MSHRRAVLCVCSCGEVMPPLITVERRRQCRAPGQCGRCRIESETLALFTRFYEKDTAAGDARDSGRNPGNASRFLTNSGNSGNAFITQGTLRHRLGECRGRRFLRSATASGIFFPWCAFCQADAIAVVGGRDFCFLDSSTSLEKRCSGLSNSCKWFKWQKEWSFFLENLEICLGKSAFY